MNPKPCRISTCHRHPSEPVTGFCALCLRDRLSGLDTPSPSSSSAAANAAAASTSTLPEIRRCKSHAAAKRGGASLEPRRKSCDDRPRKNNSLFHLFSLDDKANAVVVVESKNLGLSTASDSITEPPQSTNVRVSEDPLGENGNGNEDNKGEEVVTEEEETKTMKEHIEHEWQRCNSKHNRKDFKDVLASVFGKKLLNWRQKQTTTTTTTKEKTCDLLANQKVNNAWKRKEKRLEGTDYAHRRRSCDALEPRFSMDGEDRPRFSLDEPRASWDGYMIARTIPRLAPMLSVIENAIVNENETNSGGSGQTRDYCSDSSSSLRRDNSFDCSSSGKSSSKKTVALEVDVVRAIKFIVSDGDGRGDESGCKSGDSGDPNGFKKPGKWRKGWGILGFMHRRQEEKCGEVEGDIGEKQNGEANGVVIDGDSNPDEADGDCNREEGDGAMFNGDSNGRLVRSGSVSYRSSHKAAIGSYHRSSSVVETRDYGKKGREDSVVERNRNAMMYSPSNLESGLLRFHLTPSWSHRKKSGRSRLRNSDSVSTRSMFRLN